MEKRRGRYCNPAKKQCFTNYVCRRIIRTAKMALHLLKNFQSNDEAIFEVQIILGATVGGKITRYPQRRERRPAKVFET